MTRLCLSASARQARAVILALGLAGLVASSAYAQQPADPAIIADQTTPEPARHAPTPPQASPQTDSTEPEFVRRARDWAESSQILARLNGSVDGWYPRLGGMTRGSGLAGGPGYRQHLLEIGRA